jgi:hypothetical protein
MKVIKVYHQNNKFVARITTKYCYSPKIMQILFIADRKLLINYSIDTVFTRLIGFH